MSRSRRVPFAPIAAGTAWLEGDAARYVARVLRIEAGESIVLFDPETAIEADTIVTEVRRDRVALAIEAPRPASLRPLREVTLLQATSRGDKLDAIVRDATELGATRVVPVVTERSVSRPSPKESRVDRWRRIAVEAARQCGRGDAPRIEPPLGFDEAMARFGPRGDDALGIAFDPRAATPLGRHLTRVKATTSITLLVGPEGGFTEAERDLAEASGFAPATLGPLVLRTETVCAAALGAIAAFSELGDQLAHGF